MPTGRSRLSFRKKFLRLQNLTHTAATAAYTVRSDWKGGFEMRETNNPNEDLDDLIFDEEDGLPSER